MKLFDILCDPFTKASMLQDKNGFVSNGVSYPVVNNVPVLLPKQEDRAKAVEILVKRENKIGFSWALSHWEDLAINELLQNSENTGDLLLNFGSGSPLEKEKMIQKGYSVISFDINAGYTGVDVVGDGHFLPFIDNAFEKVTAFEVLEHLNEPWTAIKEINRVLKKDGQFVGSVAFLKEFHSSYFHMSHWGVIKLLEYGGFEVEKLYGGQNVFARLIHNILPLGSAKLSKGIYSAINNMVMKFRKIYWSKKRRLKYDEPLSRFDRNYNFSFEEYEKIVFAPTVLFRARKIKEV